MNWIKNRSSGNTWGMIFFMKVFSVSATAGQSNQLLLVWKRKCRQFFFFSFNSQTFQTEYRFLHQKTCHFHLRVLLNVFFLVQVGWVIRFYGGGRPSMPSKESLKGGWEENERWRTKNHVNVRLDNLPRMRRHFVCKVDEKKTWDLLLSLPPGEQKVRTFKMRKFN